MDLQEFINKRNECLLNMDITGMKQLCIEHEIAFPANILVFTAGMHRARLFHNGFSKEVKEESKNWLRGNGFNENVELEFLLG